MSGKNKVQIEIKSVPAEKNNKRMKRNIRGVICQILKQQQNSGLKSRVKKSNML